MIALRALGKAEIVTPTDRLTPSQEILFAAALYLFLQRAKPLSRATMAETLWPGIGDSARQHRLRQTIFQLKQVGVPLEATRETVLLPADVRESDLDVLFIHGAGDIGAVESLQFLPGYAPAFSVEFSSWLDLRRNVVSSATSRLLINDIRRARSRGDWLRVERLAFRCIEADQFNEEAVLARAEASAMRGAKREAVTILDQYVADLGAAAGEIKLPANLMRKRIAERVPEATFNSRAEGIFVGREADMSLLTTLLDDARSGKGRCCLLWGDAGIGKSRLAAELGRFGELQGAQVRRVACRRGDAQRPLSVFVEAVPQLREMRGALGCSPDTMADLQRLTQFDIGNSAKPAMELDPQSIFELIRFAIFDLIDAVSEEQCLVLVVEDVHWLDAASARILGQLADWAAKKHLLLLFTSRMRENPLLESCTRAGLVTHRLRPLSDDAAAQLVREMFEATNEESDAEFVAWCRTVGDGNPFFLHELVKQWLETKQRHVIPPSITTVIRERFSRLSSEGTQLLQACSILGENSTLPRVEKMLQHEPYMLLGALNELSKASMLSGERKPVGESKDFKLAPKHDLISMVAIEELDPHAAAFLHRRAGEVLEAELGENAHDTSLLWACAQHWQRAGDEERSVMLAKHFAQHLIQVGHPQNAADLLQKVIAGCTDPAQREDLRGTRLRALDLAHNWEAIRSDIGAVRNGMETPTRIHDDYELTYFDAVWRSSFDFRALVVHLQPCLEDVNASAPHRVRAGNLALKAASDFGDPHILDSIFAAIAPVLDAPDVDPIERCEAKLVYHCSNEDGSQVPQLAEALVKAARAGGSVTRASAAMRNAGYANLKFGFLTQAFELLNQNVEELIAAKLTRHARHASYELARAYLDVEQVAPARACIERFRIDTDTDEAEYIRQAWAAAKLAIAEKDVDGALKHFQVIERVPPAHQTNMWKMATLAMRVRLEILRRSPAAVVKVFVDQLLPVFAKNQHLGRNDYEASAVVMGLEYLELPLAARDLVRRYIKVRRERTTPPAILLAALNRPVMRASRPRGRAP